MSELRLLKHKQHICTVVPTQFQRNVNHVKKTTSACQACDPLGRQRQAHVGRRGAPLRDHARRMARGVGAKSARSGGVK